jgi:thioredoxin 1
MADAEDDIDEIRERKREKLLEGEGGPDADSEGTPDEPVEISGMEELERVVSENRVVLIDCYADWCGPCKMMEPVVEELAAERDAVVAKVDVDANQTIAAELGARSIPTFVLFVEGESTEQLVGAQEKATFEQLLEAA